MTTRATSRPIPEQQAVHVYNPVPARSHATVSSRTTQEPAASEHHAGHYAGIHPEDSPRTTASQGIRRRSISATSAPLEQEEEDRAYETRRASSSARRYPIKKAMPKRASLPQLLIAAGSIVTGMTLALLVPPIWNGWMDQLHYGFPRLMQVDANVGHGTAQAPITRFIAINNHSLIEVLEVPTGMPGKNDLHVYLVSQLSGTQADNAPVTVEFADVNGDHKPDMLVTCSGNRFILYNDGHQFTKAL